MASNGNENPFAAAVRAFARNKGYTFRQTIVARSVSGSLRVKLYMVGRKRGHASHAVAAETLCGAMRASPEFGAFPVSQVYSPTHNSSVSVEVRFPHGATVPNVVPLAPMPEHERVNLELEKIGLALGTLATEAELIEVLDLAAAKFAVRANDAGLATSRGRWFNHFGAVLSEASDRIGEGQ